MMRGRPPKRNDKKREKPRLFRDSRLATIPSANKKANDNANHGYAEKCRKANLFLRVTISIKEFRQKFPNSTYVETWEMLHNEYPFIFDIPSNKMYSGNISKIINGTQEWQEAYFCGKEDLIKMAEYKLSKLLESDKTSSADIIKIYDTLKKYEEFKEDDNADNEIIFSIGVKDKYIEDE